MYKIQANTLEEYFAEHRKRIKEGLAKARAKGVKLGNPNASTQILISSLPRLKETIAFAQHLKPTIKRLQEEGLSHRAMVQKLNLLGITAPRGGKWVLSQLQKYLVHIDTLEQKIAKVKEIEKLRDGKQ
jgi:DNA invertase Pin-like site-specific DNA recombinase